MSFIDQRRYRATYKVTHEINSSFNTVVQEVNKTIINYFAICDYMRSGRNSTNSKL